MALPLKDGVGKRQILIKRIGGKVLFAFVDRHKKDVNPLFRNPEYARLQVFLLRFQCRQNRASVIGSVHLKVCSRHTEILHFPAAGFGFDREKHPDLVGKPRRLTQAL